MNTLLEGLKSKKRQLKFKEEGIKNLVQETNKLNQNVNDLQLENETLRLVPIHYYVCVCMCVPSLAFYEKYSMLFLIPPRICIQCFMTIG